MAKRKPHPVPGVNPGPAPLQARHSPTDAEIAELAKLPPIAVGAGEVALADGTKCKLICAWRYAARPIDTDELLHDVDVH